MQRLKAACMRPLTPPPRRILFFLHPRRHTTLSSETDTGQVQGRRCQPEAGEKPSLHTCRDFRRMARRLVGTSRFRLDIARKWHTYPPAWTALIGLQLQ
ncbi:hypothetical protein MTO96_049743 [Rhipicephalus appendiculatus]